MKETGSRRGAIARPAWVRSVLTNLSLQMAAINAKQMRWLHKEFNPQICISDYDSFTFVFSQVSFYFLSLFSKPIPFPSFRSH